MKFLKKTSVIYLLLLIVGCNSVSTKFGEDLIKIKEDNILNNNQISGIINYTKKYSVDWHKNIAPFWEKEIEDIAVSAKISFDDKNILLYVVVKDPVQLNDNKGAHIWRDDSIYISLDGRGNSDSKNLKKDIYQEDDAVYIFAKTKEKDAARVIKHGNPVYAGKESNHLIKSIIRDEKKKETIYSIAIPFNEISTAIGQSDTIGIAMNIAHKTKSKKDLNWGAILGNAKKGKVRRYNYLRFSQPDTFVSIAPKTLRLVDSNNAEISLALKNDKPVTVKITQGNVEKEFNFDINKKTKRYNIVFPEVNPIILTISDNLENKLDSKEFYIKSPKLNYIRFKNRIDKLLKNNSNKFIKQHLKSTLAVISDSYNNLPFQTDLRTKRKEFMNFTDKILDKLPKEKCNFDDMISRGLPFVFAFIAKQDSSLQFYSLQFPYAWDKNKKYSLVIYLHGAVVNTNPLNGLLTSFDNGNQDTLFTYNKINPNNIPPSHRGFVLAPWARANSYYRENGEKDVWQSIDLVKRQFNIAENKMYLSGFSMGCHGTWRLASRTPDIWAGINLASGFWSKSDTSLDFLIPNAKNLPFKLWVGSKDNRMFNGVKEFYPKLKKMKYNAELEIAKDLPHTYPYKNFQKNIGYLLQFTKKERPNEFSFITDSFRYQGIYGIKMEVPYNISEKNLPQFECRTNGGIVIINSKNTNGLQVDLTSNGLDMKGNIEIIWNGKSVYTGKTKVINLGQKFWILKKY